MFLSNINTEYVIRSIPIRLIAWLIFIETLILLLNKKNATNTPISNSQPRLGSKKKAAVGLFIEPHMAAHKLVTEIMARIDIMQRLPHFQVRARNIGKSK